MKSKQILPSRIQMRRYFLGVFIGIVAIILTNPLCGFAQEAMSTLSGRVVKTEGSPVSDLKIGIQSGNGARGHSQTDSAGHFSITDIIPGAIRLELLPTFNPDTEMLTLEIGGLTFYPSNVLPFTWFAFELDSGVHVENIVITTQPRMRIRGRVVFENGEPLRNQHVELRITRQMLDTGRSGHSINLLQTDTEGYFIEYVRFPAIYTVFVRYQGMNALSEPFTLKTGERYDDLVLTLSPQPIDFKPPGERGKLSATSMGVWGVNPANGHAYKRIYCKSRDAAIAQAAAEKAHLVTINDAAEQKWLEGLFVEKRFFWIGLSDGEKEGQWQWDNGESLTYTNWAPHEPDEQGTMDEGDYAVMDLSSKKWLDIGAGSPFWKTVQYAIIEKENLRDEIPKTEK
jgi:hypothetical protein